MAASILGRTLARASFTQALAGEAFVRAMLAFERALAEAPSLSGQLDAVFLLPAIVAELKPLDEELAELEGTRSPACKKDTR